MKKTNIDQPVVRNMEYANSSFYAKKKKKRLNETFLCAPQFMINMFIQQERQEAHTVGTKTSTKAKIQNK